MEPSAKSTPVGLAAATLADAVHGVNPLGEPPDDPGVGDGVPAVAVGWTDSVAEDGAVDEGTGAVEAVDNVAGVVTADG